MLTILFLYRIIKHYIDYKMDYCIISPHEVMFGEQKGLFTRHFTTIDCKQLKSIGTEKWWIIESVFNNGTIIFTFMDANIESGQWKVEIDYIFDPEKKRSSINDIISPVQ